VQVFCESAGTVDLVDAVVLGDAIVSRALATQGDLIAAATAWRGGGRSAAVEAARAVRSGVRSVMESRLRMLMALAGLPEPEVNPVFRDERGEPVREYDLYYRASRTAVEYDGRQHIERERTWARDIARRERIDAVGDRVIVVTARDIFRDPAEKLSRVHAVLQERRQPGTPARLRREWELHFDQPHGHS
jgi:very-short-patch-repair endonuclease